MHDGSAHPQDRLTRLEGRLQRERTARLEAERLLEAKSRELYEANSSLKTLAASLEQRVQQRTDELTAAHRRAIDLVERDHLTGLVSRGRFVRAVEEVFDASRCTRTRSLLLLIDLDRFKDVNDGLGHEAGDALLRHVANQLLAATRSDDVVARIGGDEFCVVFRGADNEADCLKLVERIREALEPHVNLAGKIRSAQASMGFAIYPEHGRTLDEVMRHADLALYTSKAAGRGLCTAFDWEMSDAVIARQKLELSLRGAIAHGGLEPWFQPIVNRQDGRICGVETLVRWRRKDGTIALPGTFLDIVEDCGLMPALFSTVLRASLRDMRPHIINERIRYVTVNLSPSQFKLGTLAQDVTAALEDTKFPPEALVLEITEQVLLTDFTRARDQLLELTDLGIKIALDDFGNGYANIAYLRQLPIQKLKLDRTMTDGVTTDPKAFAIVAGVSGLAASLNLAIIAEGVETAAQAQKLERAGCRFQQGYLYARPMPADDLTKHLANFSKQPLQLRADSFRRKARNGARIQAQS